MGRKEVMNESNPDGEWLNEIVGEIVAFPSHDEKTDRPTIPTIVIHDRRKDNKPNMKKVKI